MGIAACGDEIRQLDPRGRSVEHVRRGLEAVPDLRPPPLRRIGATDGREQLGRVPSRHVGDRGGLRGGRVILPQPRVRREIVLPLRVHRERSRVRVHGQRRRSCRIDANRNHAIPRELGVRVSLPQRTANGHAQPVDVVGGILARQMRVLRVEQHAVIAARIIEDTRADRASVRRVDDDGTNRVRAEVDPNREGHVTPRGQATRRRGRLGRCRPGAPCPAAAGGRRCGRPSARGSQN